VYKVDYFAVDAVDLDDVEKVIIEHDGRQPRSGWFIDKVVVYSPYARGLKMLTFDCNRSSSSHCCLQFLLCLRYSTVSAKALCFWAVRPPRPFIRSSGHIWLPRYLINGLSNLDETYRE